MPGATWCRIWLMVIFLASALVAAAVAEEVQGYSWPPGFFYRLGRLKVSAFNQALDELDSRLAGLRQQQAGLLVKGEITGPLTTGARIYAEVQILDQSGLLILARNVPNLYYGFAGPSGRLNRNTFFVLKNPHLDRIESQLRRQFVIRGEFLAFVRKYLEALRAEWHALPAPELAERCWAGKRLSR